MFTVFGTEKSRTRVRDFVYSLKRADQIRISPFIFVLKCIIHLSVPVVYAVIMVPAFPFRASETASREVIRTFPSLQAER